MASPRLPLQHPSLIALTLASAVVAGCQQAPAPTPPAPAPVAQTATPAPAPPAPPAPVALGTGVTPTGIDLASIYNRSDEAGYTAANVTAAEGDAALAPDDPLRVQVLLERAFFSPGEIDGRTGSNQERALKAYQTAHDLPSSGKPDAATLAKLAADTAPILITYTLTEDDVKGPFKPIPADTMAKAQMDSLPYSSVEEALGEKFHTRPDLLKKLNPGADLAKAGTVLTVPNVQAATNLPTPASLKVIESAGALQLLDADGKVLAQFPVTTGSAQFPLPIGEWTINGVAKNPVWHFDPKLIAGTKATDRKAQIPAGPNNPVGIRWIDLSKEHYGIHGTPEPGKIGKTESNGCIRMTNWSVAALSRVVTPGLKAVFVK